MGSGLDDHIVRARGILPYLLGSLARALLRTSALPAFRYDLRLRITVATLGGAQGNVRPSAWLRTWRFGPWTSSRVTFGPTPKNENEMKMESPLGISLEVKPGVTLDIPANGLDRSLSG